MANIYFLLWPSTHVLGEGLVLALTETLLLLETGLGGLIEGTSYGIQHVAGTQEIL